jgi:CheY-like chemotaxis protein
MKTMIQVIRKAIKMNHQALAALINKLQAPLVVSDILTGKETGEESSYALTRMISDMQPDAAILAIALSMRKIVQPYLKASPSLQMTEIECTRLTEDYAHQWTTQPLNAETPYAEAFETLEQAAEDLEYLEELLDLNINYLNSKDIGGVALCRLLRTQTIAQRHICEAFCGKLESEIDREDDAVLASNAESPSIEDNIIFFPAK